MKLTQLKLALLLSVIYSLTISGCTVKGKGSYTDPSTAPGSVDPDGTRTDPKETPIPRPPGVDDSLDDPLNNGPEVDPIPSPPAPLPTPPIPAPVACATPPTGNTLVGQGTTQLPYELWNANRQAVLNQWNALGTQTNSNSYIVCENINFSGIAFQPIRDFSGKFEGNNKKLSNISLTLSENGVGFFRVIRGGHVYNLEFENLILTGKEGVGIAGYAYYNRLTSTASGPEIPSFQNIKLSGASIITGEAHVGGLVGRAGGVRIDGAEIASTVILRGNRIGYAVTTNTPLPPTHSIGGAIGSASYEEFQHPLITDANYMSPTRYQDPLFTAYEQSPVNLVNVVSHAKIYGLANTAVFPTFLSTTNEDLQYAHPKFLGGVIGDGFGVDVRNSSFDGTVRVYQEIAGSPTALVALNNSTLGGAPVLQSSINRLTQAQLPIISPNNPNIEFSKPNMTNALWPQDTGGICGRCHYSVFEGIQIGSSAVIDGGLRTGGLSGYATHVAVRNFRLDQGAVVIGGLWGAGGVFGYANSGTLAGFNNLAPLDQAPYRGIHVIDAQIQGRVHCCSAGQFTAHSNLSNGQYGLATGGIIGKLDGNEVQLERIHIGSSSILFGTGRIGGIVGEVLPKSATMTDSNTIYTLRKLSVHGKIYGGTGQFAHIQVSHAAGAGTAGGIIGAWINAPGAANGGLYTAINYDVRGSFREWAFNGEISPIPGITGGPKLYCGGLIGQAISGLRSVEITNATKSSGQDNSLLPKMTVLDSSSNGLLQCNQAGGAIGTQMAWVAWDPIIQVTRLGRFLSTSNLVNESGAKAQGTGTIEGAYWADPLRHHGIAGYTVKISKTNILYYHGLWLGMSSNQTPYTTLTSDTYASNAFYFSSTDQQSVLKAAFYDKTINPQNGTTFSACDDGTNGLTLTAGQASIRDPLVCLMGRTTADLKNPATYQSSTTETNWSEHPWILPATAGAHYPFLSCLCVDTSAGGCGRVDATHPAPTGCPL